MSKLKKVSEITTHAELTKELDKSFKRSNSIILQIRRTAKKLCTEYPDIPTTGIDFRYTTTGKHFQKRNAYYSFHTCLRLIEVIEKKNIKLKELQRNYEKSMEM